MAAEVIMDLLCLNDLSCNTASLFIRSDSFIAAVLFVYDMQKEQLGH